jgi:hypothetical protein
VRKLCVVFLAFGLADFSAAQLVQIGPDESPLLHEGRTHKGKPTRTILGSANRTRRRRERCAVKKSLLELRRYVSEARQVRAANAKTDDNGDFQLGEVSKGDYRLLASSTRTFNQPDESWCNSGGQCFLRITLQVNPTDSLASQCPIR